MKAALSLVPDIHSQPVETTVEAKLRASMLRESTSRSSIWEPVLVAPPPAAPVVSIPFERELVVTILQPRADGESHRAFNDRKERELLGLLDRLTGLEALTLHRRLTRTAAGDPVVAAFARLVAERRNRILAFLADTRRRQAIRR